MRRFLARLAAFVLLIWSGDVLVIDSMPVVGFLYRNRPDWTGVAQERVEKQIMALEYVTRMNDPLVLFLGSSSVVNGIDVARIQPALKDGKRAINAGLTALLASELPMLRAHLIRPNVKTIVYLYNSFSFPDDVHPQASRTRWNTAEFLRIATPSQWVRYRRYLVEGSLSQLFTTLRYRVLLQGTVTRMLDGTLGPPPDDFDYPLDEATPPQRPRTPEPPIDDWNRAVYVQSDTMDDTLGYRGFVRFLQLAKQAHIKTIVMPVPEPEFAQYVGYRVGTNSRHVDQRIAAICAREGIPYVPRGEVAALEARDEYFRDTVHFHTVGRRIFSDYLAARATGF